jgi:hypothetical protein
MGKNHVGKNPDYQIERSFKNGTMTKIPKRGKGKEKGGKCKGNTREMQG